MLLFDLIRFILLSCGTIFLIYISRKSFRDYSAHGFYRFFVFELTLTIVILNLPYWIDEPLSIHQLISWILLAFSIYLIIASLYFLKKIGSSKKREGFDSNFEFENTAKLVTSGIYKYLRHPMYGSLMFLSLGVLLKNVKGITSAISMITILFIVLTAKTEEKENIKFFGSPYHEYMQRTKMFIPFLF